MQHHVIGKREIIQVLPKLGLAIFKADGGHVQQRVLWIVEDDEGHQDAWCCAQGMGLTLQLLMLMESAIGNDDHQLMKLKARGMDRCSEHLLKGPNEMHHGLILNEVILIEVHLGEDLRSMGICEGSPKGV